MLFSVLPLGPQVLGRDQRGLHPHEKRSADRRHDRGGVVRGAGRVAGTTVRLEGPGLPGPHQHPAAMYGQPGHRLPDIRHVLHVLSTTTGHPVSLLEDIQNCPAADPPKEGPAERHARALQVGSTRAVKSSCGRSGSGSGYFPNMFKGQK